MKHLQMLGLLASSRGCRNAARLAFLALAAGLAVNCSGSGNKNDPVIEANVAPADYRTQITETIQRMLDDPTGIRDAFVTEPALRQSGADTRYISCLRYNAKNRDGAYMGSRDRAAFFYNGRVTTIADAPPELCRNAPYQPFPELEKLCREIVCPKR
jgi:hypothetical protein